MKRDSESTTGKVQAVLYCCATNGCRETFWTLADANIHANDTWHWNLVLRELKNVSLVIREKAAQQDRSPAASTKHAWSSPTEGVDWQRADHHAVDRRY